MLRAVLVVIGAASLAGCDVGEVDIGGGGMPDAPGGASAAKIAMFDSTIKPMADAKGCVSGGCHGGVQVPVLNSFGTLTAKYYTGPSAINVMITKDVVNGVATGTHSALPYFSAAEKTTVAAWIDMQ
ncbi:MAG: hypothetical protein H0T42_04335 [Deltaproteobacteria bacterium]|nr:hypothetical protein [Deltaproteobacteria bacterium]